MLPKLRDDTDTTQYLNSANFNDITICPFIHLYNANLKFLQLSQNIAEIGFGHSQNFILDGMPFLDFTLFLDFNILHCHSFQNTVRLTLKLNSAVFNAQQSAHRQA